MPHQKRLLSPYRIISALMFFIGSAAMAGLIFEYGFGMPDHWDDAAHAYEFVGAYIFCFLQLLKLVVVEHPVRYLRKHWLQFTLVLLMLFQLAAGVGIRASPEYKYLEAHYRQVPLTSISLAFVQLYFIVAAFVGSAAFHRLLAKLRLNPVAMVGTSFAAFITLGAVFLKFPKAANPGQFVSWTDAFFTATSAACVTGLTTVDTGATFSLFGQTVTLVLIQIGGLGVITFTAFMAFFNGSGIYGDDAKKIMIILNDDQRHAGRSLFKIIGATLAIEGLGAVLLYHGLHSEIADPVKRAYFALYHSVSGFCNAGFGLYADSLCKFRGDTFIILTTSALIVLGGIGMPVLFGAPRAFWNVLRGRFSEVPAHLKIVLGISAFMILAGTVFFFMAAGQPGFMEGFTLKEKLLSALFLSISTRTCGFATFDVSNIGILTASVCMLLMFIGGSPASTAGGIKTTGAGVLCAAAYKVLFKKPYEAIRLGGTIVIRKTVRKAVIITAVMLGWSLCAVTALSFMENLPLEKIVFEVVSATGTVGLTMGITPMLTCASKWVLIVCMYIGRVSPGIIVVMINNRNAEKEDIILG